jgi:hypothetical protein
MGAALESVELYHITIISASPYKSIDTPAETIKWIAEKYTDMKFVILTLGYVVAWVLSVRVDRGNWPVIADAE